MGIGYRVVVRVEHLFSRRQIVVKNDNRMDEISTIGESSKWRPDAPRQERIYRSYFKKRYGKSSDTDYIY